MIRIPKYALRPLSDLYLRRKGAYNTTRIDNVYISDGTVCARIEAVTDEKALEAFREKTSQLGSVSLSKVEESISSYESRMQTEGVELLGQFPVAPIQAKRKQTFSGVDNLAVTQREEGGGKADGFFDAHRLLLIASIVSYEEWGLASLTVNSSGSSAPVAVFREEGSVTGLVMGYAPNYKIKIDARFTRRPEGKEYEETTLPALKKVEGGIKHVPIEALSEEELFESALD